MLTFSDLLFSTDFIQFETPCEIPNFDNLYDLFFREKKLKIMENLDDFLDQ